MRKRLVILGAGESGTGAALLGKAVGYDVFVSENGPIKDKYKDELTREGIEFEETKHTEDRILAADLVIKSPGIPDKAEIVKKVAYQQIPVIDEIEFAFRHLNGERIIAITGTNGKTTTTLLTYHLLKSAGFAVGLGGNVGQSLARQLTQQKPDWYVLELSSFQLDGTETFKPDVAVLLNITPDHLDRYEYNLQNYINSKFQIVENMEPQQHFIFYGDDPVVKNELTAKSIVPRQIPVSLSATSSSPVKFDGSKMVYQLEGQTFSILQSDTTLQGPHNLINTMAAVSAAFIAGVPLAAIRSGLKTFKNAPHRLESVGTINGVEFINDSKATNVDAVVYALGSFDRPLIWIAGGVDKGNDYSVLMNEAVRKVKALICLGKDNAKLKTAFNKVVPRIEETQSVKELVRQALALASAGDVVLLSPACASFDLFKNYEDRGSQFREAVADLKNEIENK